MIEEIPASGVLSTRRKLKQMGNSIFYRIRVWLAWKTVSSAADHSQGHYRMINTITGDRRQVNSSCRPYKANSWASRANGRGYHFHRPSETWYEVNENKAA